MRRNFSSSRLVRLLGEAAGIEVETPRQDFAERLSLWLDAFDAIQLQAAQQPARMPARPQASRADAARLRALEAEFHRMRQALVKALDANDAPRAAGKPAAPLAAAQASEATQADYGPFRQRYLDRQRQMELRIGPFRAHVRQTLAAASPGLRQLALLDAAFEETLGGREQRLLSSVPALLERRFEQLRQAQPAAHWLQAFGQEWHEVLLAEMQVRLQPVAGLIEAFSNEVKKYQ